MNFIQNAFKLSGKQKKLLAVFLGVLTLTSTRVQAAEASEILPDSPEWQTGQVMADDMGDRRGLIIPPTYLGALPVAENAPASRTYTVSMTAYNSEIGQTDATPFVTADGSHVREGIVAANFLKFGSKIRIPALFGDRVFEVHDRMNARYDLRVDIWMTTHSDAIKFGMKRAVTIEVL